MSRIGREPIYLPSGVNVDRSDENIVVVSGPKGALRQFVDACIVIEKGENEGKQFISLKRVNETREVKSKHGMYRATLANMVKGVTEGFKKSISIKGVGYKVAVSGNTITFNIGLSHPVNVEIPSDLACVCPNPTTVEISGIDKIKVGQFAADLRAIKPVEPYHGYGIYYTNEHVRRKEIKKTGKK